MSPRAGAVASSYYRAGAPVRAGRRRALGDEPPGAELISARSSAAVARLSLVARSAQPLGARPPWSIVVNRTAPARANPDVERVSSEILSRGIFRKSLSAARYCFDSAAARWPRSAGAAGLVPERVRHLVALPTTDSLHVRGPAIHWNGHSSALAATRVLLLDRHGSNAPATLTLGHQRGAGAEPPLGTACDCGAANVPVSGTPMGPTGMYTVVWFGEFTISFCASMASCWM
jgi:hypothetical protein